MSLSGIVDIKDVAVRKEVVKRIGKAVKGKHLDGCPWRIKACPGQLSNSCMDATELTDR